MSDPESQRFPEKHQSCLCSIEPLLFTLVFIGGGVSWYLLDKFLK